MKHHITISLEGLSKVIALPLCLFRSTNQAKNPFNKVGEPGSSVEKIQPISQTENLYIDRGFLFVENMAKLPLERCIKTNAPTHKVVRVHLRNPFQPLTWWGERSRKLTIGLSKSSLQKQQLFHCLSWLLVGLSAAILVTSPFFNSWLLLLAPVLFVLGSMLRSAAPVWAVVAERKVTVIGGIAPAFGRKFDQYEDGKPLN